MRHTVPLGVKAARLLVVALAVGAAALGQSRFPVPERAPGPPGPAGPAGPASVPLDGPRDRRPDDGPGDGGDDPASRFPLSITTPRGEASQKRNVYPLGERFQLGPLPKLERIRQVIIGREKVVQVDLELPLTRTSITAHLRGIGLGVSEVTLVGEDGRIEPFTVTILPSLGYINTFIETRFPLARVRAEAAGDQLIVLRGTVDTPAEAQDIVEFVKSVTGKGGGVINSINVLGVQQVQLEVCIAQVDRTALRALAVNALFSDARGFAGNQTGNLLPSPTVNGGMNPATLNPGAVVTGDANVFFGLTRPDFNLFTVIQALKNEGVAKILASPTLVTLNGKPADFLVGGEQPIPILQNTGVGLGVQGIQYKKFGIRLTFVPVLVNNGRIRLDVVPEVSRPSTSAGTIGGVNVVSFDTQRLRATVEMDSGQTLALGGLLRQEDTVQVQKVPVLGDLPWVGSLFRRLNATKRETELIILITPRLAEPLRGCQRPAVLPGQESRPPNDAELYLKGVLEVPLGGVPTQPVPSPLPGSIGPVPSGEAAAPGELPPPRPPEQAAGPAAPVYRGVAEREDPPGDGLGLDASLERLLELPRPESFPLGVPTWLRGSPPEEG